MPSLPFSLVLLILPALQFQPPAPSLFESAEPLAFRIEADFEQLDDDRGQETVYRDARFFLTGDDGAEIELPLKLKTRGNFRLKKSTCRFPPLRLNFPKSALAGTPLDGEDKLKLVTHCRDDEDYEQNVLEEYLIYRAYNLITDYSFRVRLARITYAPTNGGKPLVRWGFLIEDADAVAARLGGTLLAAPQVPPHLVSGAHEGRIALFQYMVGNTDFSIYFRHNVELLQNGAGEVVPVPYDFDWSGMVNAKYARPDASLGTRTVKERLYRGLCRPDVDFPSFFGLFNERRGEIEELYRSQPGLRERERKQALDYLTDFYDTINDQRKAKRQIQDACRKV
ncbi:MAG: hypothetical protein ACRELD_01335 [Longimicrobiales bacterium]